MSVQKERDTMTERPYAGIDPCEETTARRAGP